MKSNLTYNSKLLKSIDFRWVMTALLLFVFSFVYSGEIPGKNKIIVIGQVVNNINGAPIENQEVIISTDSTYKPNFPYFKKVTTDKEGYYYDSIIAPYIKGSLNIYTYDYLDNLYDSIVYFSFKDIDNNILFAHFRLPVEPILNIYQANFYYQKNPGGQNYLNYQFYDISNSEDIISWYWDFGDDTFSTEENPFHTFSEPGLYRVELTVRIVESGVVKPIETSIVKIINITPKSYFHIGGHVFADYFPIDIGEVYLYKVGDIEVEPIDTAMFSGQYGFYIFPQIEEGQYFVKADLHYTSEYYNQFLSTYYSNKLHWKEADTIFNYVTNWEYDLDLVPNSKLMTGPGKVSGDISFGNDPKNPIGPAGYVEIILYDAENNLVDVCHSNKDGVFELEALDLQSYFLYAEVTGKHTVPLLVVLDENRSEITGVKLAIGDNGVNGSFSLGYNDNMLSKTISEVYPNPTTNKIYFDIDPQLKNELTYSLIDQQGRSVKTGAINPGDFKSYLIDVDGLKPGFYFIRVEGKTQFTTRRFIKQ